MVSDGDSKAFSSVEDIYGEIKVEKLDCVGHVQKVIGKTPSELEVHNERKAFLIVILLEVVGG